MVELATGAGAGTGAAAAGSLDAVSPRVAAQGGQTEEEQSQGMTMEEALERIMSLPGWNATRRRRRA